MTAPDWRRIHRKAYTDGWVDQPPENSPARGCLHGLLLGGAGWAAVAAIVRWLTG